MPPSDPFAPLDRLANVQDVHDLDQLLREARVAGREVAAKRPGQFQDEKAYLEYTHRVNGIMKRVEANEVFRDPRAARALEVMADLFARLT